MTAPSAIDSADDVDVYQVRAGRSRLPGETLTITAASQTAGLGIRMTVFDASGQPLTSAASGGEGHGAITLSLQEGELVYLAVAGLGDADTGAYTLRVAPRANP